MITIAHAYANRRDRWQRAIDAGVDFIETDLRFDGRRIWVRHEHRLGRLPLLYNRRPRASHVKGPWALNLGGMFLRLDVRPIRFEEFLDAVSGRAGLLLDFKTGHYPPDAARALVERSFALLAERRFEGAVDACGSWPLLEAVRALRPDMLIHYSVDNDAGWDSLLARLRAGDPIRGITIKRQMLDDAKGALLREHGLHFYVWNVFDEQDAQEAERQGAAGIIADDLDLLRRHAGAAKRSESA